MRTTTPHLTDRRIVTAVVTSPACIVQIYGGPLGRRIEITGDDITIGRDDDNIISVPMHTVSRRHSRIYREGSQHLVADLESTNGTFVNDVEITGATPLRNGDLIKCGGAVFKFIEGGNVEGLYHEEIHRLTITDGLTQIANKRYFGEFMEREIARATRHHRPLALLMFDIDHFKKVNDVYGHLTGDRILCGVAQIIAAEVRREELVARWGGEEFAVVLPETSIKGARQFGERIRLTVEQTKFEYDDRILQVTVSVGAASLAAGDTPESLIAKTDALLYQAKEKGRNRVCAE